MKPSGGTRGPRIYPAIDLRGGRCVRLVRGAKEAEIRYDEDPLEAARRWVAEGASWLHVVDLGAAFGERDSTDEVLRIARSVAVPVQMGGGVRTQEGLRRLLEGGVARVMLGTMALKDPDFLARAIGTHGGERILVSLDCAAGRLRISGWEEESALGLEEAVARLESAGVSRFLVTATDRDGTFEGPRLDLVRRVLDAGRSRVIAAGGMGGLEHVRSVLESRHPRLDGVVIGRALYEGRIRLGEAISLEAEFGNAMSDATKKAEDDLIGGFKYDSSGLIPAVVQDSVDGQVLMVAYMNREALRRTLESGVTCFWSRSRQEYWVKGATSGNTQKVVRVLVDCDKDCLIVVVEQKGVACHTGKRSCFYREVHADGLPEIDTTAPVWKP